MLMLKTVNRELQKTLPGYELVKGEGYFYVDGPDTETWGETMIYAYRINDMSLEQWIESVDQLFQKGALK